MCYMSLCVTELLLMHFAGIKLKNIHVCLDFLLYFILHRGLLFLTSLAQLLIKKKKLKSLILRWVVWGALKNTYELLYPRALKMLWLYTVSFNVWVRYFVWNFKGTLWSSTQNIFTIHWKMCISFRCENLRALRFKSSQVSLKHTPVL